MWRKARVIASTSSPFVAVRKAPTMCSVARDSSSVMHFGGSVSAGIFPRFICVTAATAATNASILSSAEAPSSLAHLNASRTASVHAVATSAAALIVKEGESGAAACTTRPAELKRSTTSGDQTTPGCL